MRGWNLADGLRSWRQRDDAQAHATPLERIRLLHAALMQKSIDDDAAPADAEETATIIRELTQILVLADRTDTAVVDFFLEKNIHLVYLTYLRSPHVHPSVTLQILQSLNIIFDYLLSKFVNQIISLDLNFTNDEITSYYVTFLRTCTLKVSKNTLHFFFDDAHNTFPIFTSAMRFLHYPDLMVRTAIRSLTLNLLRVDEPKVVSWFLLPSNQLYFDSVAGSLHQVVDRLGEELRSQARPSTLSSLLLDHMDELHYINDVLSLAAAPICDRLCQALVDRVVFPLYVRPLGAAAEPDEHTTGSRQLPLMLLLHTFQVLRYSPLVNFVASLLLLPEIAVPLGSLWVRRGRKDTGRFTSVGAVKFDMRFDDSLLHRYGDSPKNVYRAVLLDALDAGRPEYDVRSAVLCLNLLLLIISSSAIAPETLFAVKIASAKTAKSRTLFSALTDSTGTLSPAPISTAFSTSRHRKSQSVEVRSSASGAITGFSISNSSDSRSPPSYFDISGDADAMHAFKQLVSSPSLPQPVPRRRPSFHAFVHDGDDDNMNPFAVPLSTERASLSVSPSSPLSQPLEPAVNCPEISDELLNHEILGVLFDKLTSPVVTLTGHRDALDTLLLHSVETMIFELAYYRGTVFTVGDEHRAQLAQAMDQLRQTLRQSLVPDSMEDLQAALRTELSKALDGTGSNMAEVVFQDIEAPSMTHLSKDGELVIQGDTAHPPSDRNLSLYHRLNTLMHLERLKQTLFPAATSAMHASESLSTSASSKSLAVSLEAPAPVPASSAQQRRHRSHLSSSSSSGVVSLGTPVKGGGGSGSSNHNSLAEANLLFRKLGVPRLTDLVDTSSAVPWLVELLLL
ncbi:Protein CL16A [Sorochytrium milnesiophthora]